MTPVFSLATSSSTSKASLPGGKFPSCHADPRKLGGSLDNRAAAGMATLFSPSPSSDWMAPKLVVRVRMPGCSDSARSVVGWAGAPASTGAAAGGGWTAVTGADGGRETGVRLSLKVGRPDSGDGEGWTMAGGGAAGASAGRGSGRLAVKSNCIFSASMNSFDFCREPWRTSGGMAMTTCGKSKSTSASDWLCSQPGGSMALKVASGY